jgi:tRNA modification GTPase
MGARTFCSEPWRPFKQGGAAGTAGEFTLRAYLHRKIALDQAEAVATLIQAQSEAAHRLALSQLRGTYFQKVRQLRQNLIDYLALLELELDFSEEDVEFASRPGFRWRLWGNPMSANLPCSMPF